MTAKDHESISLEMSTIRSLSAFLYELTKVIEDQELIERLHFAVPAALDIVKNNLKENSISFPYLLWIAQQLNVQVSLTFSWAGIDNNKRP